MILFSYSALTYIPAYILLKDVNDLVENTCIYSFSNFLYFVAGTFEIHDFCTEIVKIQDTLVTNRDVSLNFFIAKLLVLKV